MTAAELRDYLLSIGFQEHHNDGKWWSVAWVTDWAHRTVRYNGHDYRVTSGPPGIHTRTCADAYTVQAELAALNAYDECLRGWESARDYPTTADDCLEPGVRTVEDLRAVAAAMRGWKR